MENWIKKSELDSNKYPEATEEELQLALKKAKEQVKKNAVKHGGKVFPAPASKNNMYTFGENLEWTTGFWTGEVWLSYENAETSEEKELFLKTAQENMESFLDRIDNHINVDHHDMGFLYSLSCVAGYELTGSEIGKEAALKAADNLMNRWQEKGQFLQAWGALGAKDNYRLIIDCLLNVPLLYWASRVTEDPHYAEIAQKHIDTTLKYVIREDYSTWHTIFFDPKTGDFERGQTAQGYKDDSSWARGQAWGVYGCALAYRNTKNKVYMDYFEKVTDYYLAHLPNDLIPYWDLIFGNLNENEEPRDSSSAAIVACGLLEMAKYVNEEKAAYYRRLASKMMKSLIDSYQVQSFEESNGILLHGTYAKKSPYNTVGGNGVDECVIWGDYYFMEALERLLNPDWKIYW